MLERAGPEPRLAALDLPAPPVGERDALVQVAACGLCRHDLLVMEGTLRRGVKLPLAPGHEIAGVVADAGAKVANLRSGDRVVCLPIDGCGQCEWCLQGEERFCPEARRLGHGSNGGMAQFVSVRETGLVKVPAHLPWEQACLLACPIGVGLQAVEKAQIQPGERVVVTGAGGGLGAHVVQMARNRGAVALAVTSSEEKADALKRLGAAEVIVTGELDFSEVVLALTGDRGADAVIDTVGSPLFPSVIRSLAPSGRVVILGEVAGKPARLNLAELIFRKATLVSSLGTSRRHVEEAVELVAEGRIRPVVSRAVPWREAMDAYRILKAGKGVGRVVLDFTQVP